LSKSCLYCPVNTNFYILFPRPINVASLVNNDNNNTMEEPNIKTDEAAKLLSFQEYLKSADRIVALLGAGLSAPSGLQTFRGKGAIWGDHEAASLSDPQMFRRDPGLVWQFHSHRRHVALRAEPNAAHLALAELARKKKNFVALSQNIDGRSCPLRKCSR
jgi:Sir2 family